MKRSAGILLYRLDDGSPQVLLVHPGGPLWVRRDDHVWSIPKGEYDPDEEPEACARRELAEELGIDVPTASALELEDLGEVRQASGKLVRAFAARGDFDPAQLRSNTFTMQWPPRSGRTAEFPEVDRAQWCSLPEAQVKLVPAQAAFLERLAERLAG